MDLLIILTAVGLITLLFLGVSQLHIKSTPIPPQETASQPEKSLPSLSPAPVEPELQTKPVQKPKTNLPYKSDWKKIEIIRRENSIKALYHFTDMANLKSIKQYGGLYSWFYCQENGIIITFPGGDKQSRDQDRFMGMHDYVHLSFTNNHPMKQLAVWVGRIQTPVVLEIDPEVMYFKETKFCTINTASYEARPGDNAEYLRRIDFSLFRPTVRYKDLTEYYKKRFQAEVLVKTHIPIDFIRNISTWTRRT